MDQLFGKVLEEAGQLGGGNIPQGGGYPAGAGVPHEDDEDLRGAASHAADNAPEDSSFFSSIVGQLGQRKQQVASEDIDEEAAVRHHQQFFGGGGGAPEAATNSGIGSAAAMQALKLFTSGGSGSGGGQSQSQFIGLAMAQASKLFDQQASAGNVSAGASKESAVTKAGELALKMYMKSQVSGGSGGNLSGLFGMASKFIG